VDQAGSRRHCGSHPSVASSIAPDQWCTFCTPLQYFPHAVINWIQIWWIWRPQLKRDKFSSLSKNASVEPAQWSFQVSQGSVETLFRWGEKRCSQFIQETTRQISSELPVCCRKYSENILVSFFLYAVYIGVGQSLAIRNVLHHCYFPITMPYNMTTTDTSSIDRDEFCDVTESYVSPIRPWIRSMRYVSCMARDCQYWGSSCAYKLQITKLSYTHNPDL